jgi:hypothetical protein
VALHRVDDQGDIDTFEFDVDLVSAWRNAQDLQYGAVLPSEPEPDEADALGWYLGLRFVERIVTERAATDRVTELE